MPKDIMILSGYGLDVRVSGGHLKVKDGFPFDQTTSKEKLINRGTNDIEHLVILGQTGSISFEAIRWIIDQKMMVSIIDPNGVLVTNLMPESHISGIVKRRQATANQRTNIEIASWLLAEKFRGQRETLSWIKDNFKKADWWNTERENRFQEAISISIDRSDRLIKCKDVDSQRILEAQAAAAYWHCYEGIPLKWTKPFKVPLNWISIGNRVSPKSKSTRKAIDPFHAALNYLYTVLETKTKHTCFVNNVDPDFGVIHVDHGTRASLVYDLMEPIRPKVDRILFNWIYDRNFDPKDFFETREGICRISQDVVLQIIPLMTRLNGEINEVIKQFGGYFRNKVVVQRPEKFQRIKPKSRNKVKTSQIVLPFDDRSQKRIIDCDVESQHSENDNIRCLECGKIFRPQTKTQKFCCKKHRNTHHARLKREERTKQGLCPQCGKPMQVTAAGTMKERLTYCDECRDYWKRRDEDKKLHAPWT